MSLNEVLESFAVQFCCPLNPAVKLSSTRRCDGRIGSIEKRFRCELKYQDTVVPNSIPMWEAATMAMG